MTARYVADETALREALADWLGARPEAYNVTDPSDEQTTFIKIGVEDLADSVLLFLDRSIVVQSREDAVREAKAEALREAADAIALDFVRAPFDSRGLAWLRDRAAALTPTDPGMDRPAVAEDGQDPRYSGTERQRALAAFGEEPDLDTDTGSAS